MRRFFRTLLVLCALELVSLAAAPRSDAQFFSLTAGDTIPRVSAVGSVAVPVTPDRAVVYAAVAGRDSTGPGALAEAVAIRDRAMAALARAGVRGEQMAPWGFAYGREGEQGPRMARPGPGAEPMTARWGLRVVVDRLDRLDAVLGALAAAGIERTAHVTYQATRDAEARRAATEQAVAQARREAEAMARAAGGRLGSLLMLSNLSGAGEALSSESRFFFSQGGFERGAVLNPSDTQARVVVHGTWTFLRN